MAEANKHPDISPMEHDNANVCFTFDIYTFSKVDYLGCFIKNVSFRRFFQRGSRQMNPVHLENNKCFLHFKY